MESIDGVKKLSKDLADARVQIHNLQHKLDQLKKRTVRQRILILKHTDSVRCFAEKGVEFKVIPVCCSYVSPLMVQIDEKITHSLPQSYRDIYWPTYMRVQVDL